MYGPGPSPSRARCTSTNPPRVDASRSSSRPLGRQEPGLAPVALPVLQVLLAVRDVEVAGQHDVPARRGRSAPSRRPPPPGSASSRPGAGCPRRRCARTPTPTVTRPAAVVATSASTQRPDPANSSARRRAARRTGARDSTATPAWPAGRSVVRDVPALDSAPAPGSREQLVVGAHLLQVRHVGLLAEPVDPAAAGAARMPLTLAETRRTGPSWQPGVTGRPPGSAQPVGQSETRAKAAPGASARSTASPRPARPRSRPRRPPPRPARGRHRRRTARCRPCRPRAPPTTTPSQSWSTEATTPVPAELSASATPPSTVSAVRQPAPPSVVLPQRAVRAERRRRSTRRGPRGRAPLSAPGTG